MRACRYTGGMRILVLGGTAFVGRHIVEAALARGHAITVFHRGRTNARLWPDVEHRLGDRDGDLAALRDGTWDAVVDTSAYVPRIAARSAELLSERAGLYVFISTVSVYADFQTIGITETAPRATIAGSDLETVNAESYGALKARAERAVAEHFPGRTLRIRPGIVVGPYDYTGRFAYWPRRIGEGGDVLAPGAPDHPLQVIDARDLGAFVVARLEANDPGLYNATGPIVRWGDFLQACIDLTGEKARLRWIADDALQAAGVTGADLPLWVAATPPTAGFYAISSERAVAAGLHTRPLADSIRAALDTGQGKAGMARSRETEFLRRLAETPGVTRV